MSVILAGFSAVVAFILWITSLSYSDLIMRRIEPMDDKCQQRIEHLIRDIEGVTKDFKVLVGQTKISLATYANLT